MLIDIIPMEYLPDWLVWLVWLDWNFYAYKLSLVLIMLMLLLITSITYSITAGLIIWSIYCLLRYGSAVG